MATAIKSQLGPWLERIDGLELRERLLLLATVVIVMFLLVDTLVLQPTLKSQQLIRQQMETTDTRLNGIRQNATLLGYKADSDPVASRQQTRDRLSLELEQLDERIVGQLGALVEPAEAAKLLEQVLSNHSGLTLTTLTANTEPLDRVDVSSSTDASGLARYRLDMVVEGRYLDVLNYLKSLEAMPWKFFWQQVALQSTEYPHAETRLQLYTLGADNG